MFRACCIPQSTGPHQENIQKSPERLHVAVGKRSPWQGTLMMAGTGYWPRIPCYSKETGARGAIVCFLPRKGCLACRNPWVTCLPHLRQGSHSADPLITYLPSISSPLPRNLLAVMGKRGWGPELSQVSWQEEEASHASTREAEKHHTHGQDLQTIPDLNPSGSRGSEHWLGT